MKCLFYFFWYRKYWHPGPARSLFEVQKLHVEDEGGVRRNGSRNPLSAVAHVRTDGQLGSLALGHLGHAVIPASDDLKTINNKSSIQCHLLVCISPLPDPDWRRRAGPCPWNCPPSCRWSESARSDSELSGPAWGSLLHPPAWESRYQHPSCDLLWAHWVPLCWSAGWILMSSLVGGGILYCLTGYCAARHIVDHSLKYKLMFYLSCTLFAFHWIRRYVTPVRD